MKDFKVRVWDKDVKVMRYYGFRQLGVFEYCFSEEDTMQYLKQKDAENNPIYEDDILSIKGDSKDLTVAEWGKVYEKGAIKVIGNIHENPKLIA